MGEEKKESGCSRRDLFARAAQAGLALAAIGTIDLAARPEGEGVAAAAQGGGEDKLQEVQFYKKLPLKEIQCETCPRKCVVGDIERGFCGNKENHGGKYHTLAYGAVCAANVDPIEKKPFFHFLPGTNAFSVTAAGCNFDCKFCQNWEISQTRPEQARNMPLTPADAADYAIRAGSRTIAYTYGEPTVYYEYMRDIARTAKRRGLRNVSITNGYILPKPMKALLPELHAVKIDFKAYTHRFYKNVCKGDLKPVLDTIVLLHEEKKWTELVYLVVPTLNDNLNEIRAMAKWIHRSIGVDTPLHFSRFHPIYKLRNLQDTPVGVLDDARKVCLDEGLRYVYIGNVPGNEAENTYCPGCRRVAIGRYGYTITQMNIDSRGRCRSCGKAIPGVWS